MTKFNVLFFTFLVFFLKGLSLACCHGVSGENSRAQVGEDFAVVAFELQKGFRLGEVAYQRLNIKSQNILIDGKQSVPQEGMVWVKGLPFVFRIRAGWIRRIPVQILLRSTKMVVLKSAELGRGDKIVVGGAALLRVTEMDLGEGGSDHD